MRSVIFFFSEEGADCRMVPLFRVDLPHLVSSKVGGWNCSGEVVRAGDPKASKIFGAGATREIAYYQWAASIQKRLGIADYIFRFPK